MASEATSGSGGVSAELWECVRGNAEAGEVGSLAQVEALLARGADASYKGGPEWDDPVVLLACDHDAKLPIAKALVAHGASPRERNANGNTPLQVAGCGGAIECVKWLLTTDAVADLMTADSEGDTALHDTVANGCVDVARVLVAAGADVNAANKAGRTPLDVAYDLKLDALEQSGEGDDDAPAADDDDGAAEALREARELIALLEENGAKRGTPAEDGTGDDA